MPLLLRRARLQSPKKASIRSAQHYDLETITDRLTYESASQFEGRERKIIGHAVTIAFIAAFAFAGYWPRRLTEADY